MFKSCNIWFPIINCSAPQDSILLYTHIDSSVFADDHHVYKRLSSSRNGHRPNDNLIKLSLNGWKYSRMVFAERNTICEYVNIVIHNKNVRVHITKLFDVEIDVYLNLKKHIEYTRKNLSKYVGLLAKTRQWLDKSCLINLYHICVCLFFLTMCGTMLIRQIQKKIAQ